MSVSTGTRLGPYEIVAPLGAGGMGEVFKARDTRLDRSAAIKVLPAGFAADAQLRLRFGTRGENDLAAQPSAHLHALRRRPPRLHRHLVMELVDGESLAERLARSPLPIGETLKIGAQIADALDRAHRAGIVHRDLKPGNVMLSRTGAKLPSDLHVHIERAAATVSRPDTHADIPFMVY